VGLELLQGLGGVVDQSEAGGLATTVLRAETEHGDLVLVGLVQVGQLLAELVLGDVRAVGVEDVPRNSRKMSDRCFSSLDDCIVCFDVSLLSGVVWSFNFLVARLFDDSTAQFQKSRGGRKGFLHDHLLTGKQRVADELASPQSNGSVGHFGVCWMEEVSTGSLRMSNFQFSCGVGSARVDSNPIGEIASPP
jgi:hypothetical protein